MRKLLSYILFTLFVNTLNAQDISVISVNINKSDAPLSYKNIFLFDGMEKISWSFTDKNGSCSFTIDAIPLNTDSMYFSIKESDSSSLRIYIDELKLLRINEFENYAIRIIDLKLFNEEEYEKYLRENKFLPKRKQTLAKDVD